MDQHLKIVISAVAEGIGNVRKMTREITSGGQRVKAAGAAFNRTMNEGRQSAGLLAGSLRNLLGAYAAFASAANVTRIMTESEGAIFNLKTSVAAANREFGNVGSVAEWEATVQRLSGELKIYSETSLKNAVARTVDMTKRLGLSSDQMEEVIRRSADLGAGKVELEGAIERVTAALRGEAESAEFLGLTLNENYVKAWYEANAATEKAWKDLTDLEKAQIRYQVMLEQTNEFQGRAAGSAETFGGAMLMVKSAITDAITNNKDLRNTLADVADTLRTNSGAIGKAIADLVGLGARVISLAFEYKKLIAALLGSYLAVKVIKELVLVFNALNAAIVVLTGSNILGWVASLGKAMLAVGTAAGLSTAAMAGIYAAAAFGIVQIGLLIKAIYEWRQAARAAEESQRQMLATSDRALASLEKFKDVRLPKDLAGTASEDLQKLQWELTRARDYYLVLINKMKETGQTEGLLEASRRLAEIREDLAEIGPVAKAALQKPAEAVKATTEQLDEFAKKAKDAYEAAKAEAKKYAEEIDQINRRIAVRQTDTEDKIRELKRANLGEEEKAADIRLQAIEKIAAANAALARYQSDDSEAARDDAKRFFDDAARLWEQYAGQGEEATSEAISGLEQIKTGLNALDQTEIGWIQKMKTQAEEMAAGIEQQLEQLTRDREANIAIELRRLEEAQAAINNLTRDETKHIYVTVHERTVQENAQGGFIGGFPRRSGKLSGFGGGDRIRSLLEAGEYIIRKEAVAKYGAGLFHALNGMRLALPDVSGMVRARLGGLVSGIRIPAMAAGGLAGATETMIVDFRAGEASLPMRVAGPRGTTRAAVKEFERELRKMGLSHR